MIGRRDGPSSVLGLDSQTFLILLETIVSENPETALAIENIYSPPRIDPVDRRADVARFMRGIGMEVTV